MTLTDRVAIVTGAGNGIGRATALALAQAGAHVVAVDVDAGAAKGAADAVAALGRRSLGLDTDVGDLASIDQMVQHVMATFGHIDVLVNNAGSPGARTSWTSQRRTGTASCASTPRGCSSACSAWPAR